jgi:tetratricopeptide (TPR) repeat protein
VLRRYCSWGLVAVASTVLVAGCGSTPSRKQAQKDALAAARRQELAQERAAVKAAEAHAHYAVGVIHEMNDESQAALAEYYQAALSDLANEPLVLDVSRRFLQSKQPEKALELVTHAAARPGASGEMYARLGLIYSQLGKSEQAVTANRTAVAKSPDSLTGYHNLFLDYLQRKQPEEAAKVLEEAAARPNPDAEFLIALAELYVNLGIAAPAQKEAAKGKALALLTRADKLNPTSPPLRLKLADDFNLLGSPTNAARLYLELLKKLPDAATVRERVRANLTDIYLRGSDPKLAVEQLEAIVRDDPTNPQAYYFLGRIALESNKPAEAADHFSKMLVLSPDFEPAYYFLAMAQIDIKKPGEALVTLGKARKKFPVSFLLEFWTAMACRAQKEYGEALKHFTAAEVIGQATDPKQLDQRFYYQVGATCERKGDYAQAEKHFEKAIKLAPDFAEAMNYLGYMWAEHGMKLERARELIEKAVKADPKNAAYLDSLAWVLFKLNEPKEALPYALKAAELSEEPDATVYDHIGDIYAALKQLDKAREAWRKSLSLEAKDEVRKKLEEPAAPGDDGALKR